MFETTKQYETNYYALFPIGFEGVRLMMRVDPVECYQLIKQQ